MLIELGSSAFAEAVNLVLDGETLTPCNGFIKCAKGNKSPKVLFLSLVYNCCRIINKDHPVVHGTSLQPTSVPCYCLVLFYLPHISQFQLLVVDCSV